MFSRRWQTLSFYQDRGFKPKVCFHDSGRFLSSLLEPLSSSCPGCFVEKRVPLHNTHPFDHVNVSSLVASSVFTVLCSHHHHPPPELFCQPAGFLKHELSLEVSLFRQLPVSALIDPVVSSSPFSWPSPLHTGCPTLFLRPLWLLFPLPRKFSP